uniref:Uncharacterized protein n=1 Tax=Biomphalaria glabrata TaxID=6526 RepID=A0A2C9KHB2_BIOGL
MKEDMEHDFTNELRNVMKIEKKECSLVLEDKDQTFTNHPRIFMKIEKKECSLEDKEQDFTNDLRNVMKIEKKECSINSQTPENHSSGQIDLIFTENIQTKGINVNQDMHHRNTPNMVEYSEALKIMDNII